MIYNSTIILPEKETEEKFIFLAGSMDQEKPNSWRSQAIVSLQESYHIFDPTQKEYGTLTELQMKNHVKWELDALNRADIILLNFLSNTFSPISLVELGLHVAGNKLIVICPKEFYKNTYVTTLCETYNTPLFRSIEQALDTLK